MLEINRKESGENPDVPLCVGTRRRIRAMSVTAVNFYRRPLPPNLVDFSSEEGKKLFTESLLAGFASIYFKLAAQFRTQDEPAYCGPSTLVMVLNALEVDPERVWKSPWRFYHESMLDCCVPLELVKRTGINLAQFSCLAVCNRLNSQMEYASDDPESEELFRANIIKSVKSDTHVLVCSYDRSVLGQTGSGHFSPVAAFHPDTDSVLVLDVARFKYPPHWVPVHVLHKAMCSLDKSTNRSRGYTLLSLEKNTRPLVIFGLRSNLGCNDSSFAAAVLIWNDFLKEKPVPDPADERLIVCRRFSQCFSGHSMTCKGVDSCKKGGCRELEEELAECSLQICREIRQTEVAQLLMSSSVAALMLAWPYQKGFSERSEQLRQYAEHWLAKFSDDSRNEVRLLNKQITVLISCSRPPVKIPGIDSK